MKESIHRVYRISLVMVMICLGYCHSMNAQTRLSIKAADSLDFIFTFNQVAVNQLPVLSITLDKLPAGKHNIKVAVPSHPEIVIDQVLTLKKNTSVYYDIEKSKGVYKLVLKSESTLMFAENTPTNQPSTAQNLMNIPTPIEAVDSSSSVQNNNSGCQSPVHPEDFEQMIAEVNAHFFETKKLDVMKNFLMHHCVRVEQLRFMMSKLSLEDYKYDLLKTSLTHIYDRDKLKSVENDFFLEKNKARVYQLLQDNP